MVSSTTNVANLNASTLTGDAVGTSGPTIPLLNGTNTWSGVQTFGSGDLVLSGASSGDLASFGSGGALQDSSKPVASLCLGTATAGIVSSNGSSGCAADGNATLSAGTLSLGASGTPGAVAMGNATSGGGTVTLEPVTGTLGTATAMLPANSGTIAETNLAQTWSAAQAVNSGDLQLNGSTSGSLTLNCAATCGTNTATIPANSGTIAETNLAQTWTGLQKFANNDFALSGSSSGFTLLKSGLPGLSSNTLTLPTTPTDTLAALGTAQTWSAAQTFGGTVTLPEGTSCTTSNCTLGANLLANAMKISDADTISGKNASAYELVNSPASGTVPTLVPDRSASTTGIGGGSGVVSVITGGTEAMYWTSSQWFAPNLSPGSSALTGYVCYLAIPGGPELALESVACISSLEEYKNKLGDIDPGEAFADLMRIKPFWGTWNQQTHPDADTREQPFVGAHQVSGVDRRLGVYGSDGALNSVRNLEPVIIAGFWYLQNEIEALKRQQGH